MNRSSIAVQQMLFSKVIIMSIQHNTLTVYYLLIISNSTDNVSFVSELKKHFLQMKKQQIETNATVCLFRKHNCVIVVCKSFEMRNWYSDYDSCAFR